MRTRRPSSPKEPLLEFESIEQMTAGGALSDGRFCVMHNSHPVDFKFRDSDSETIIVSFHGAALKTVSFPWHAGNGVMDGVNAKWIAVSDPSLLFSANLNLAWFAGSKHQPNLQTFIAQALEAIFRTVKASHVIFFGSSGGGFAALEMSRKFPQSLVIPMNPQTTLAHYLEAAVNRYLNQAWSAETLNDPALSSVCHDLVQVYDVTHQNTIAYVQNTRDILHTQWHQRPFFDKLSGSTNLWVKTGAWGDPKSSGHVIPPKKEVTEILKLSAAANGAWKQSLESQGFQLAP